MLHNSISATCQSLQSRLSSSAVSRLTLIGPCAVCNHVPPSVLSGTSSTFVGVSGPSAHMQPQPRVHTGPASMHTLEGQVWALQDRNFISKGAEADCISVESHTCQGSSYILQHLQATCAGCLPSEKLVQEGCWQEQGGKGTRGPSSAFQRCGTFLVQVSNVVVARMLVFATPKKTFQVFLSLLMLMFLLKNKLYLLPLVINKENAVLLSVLECNLMELSVLTHHNNLEDQRSVQILSNDRDVDEQMRGRRS
jgi:hypothetical protein